MDYYDYIIVGGGASGLMSAYRMSKDVFFDDKTILILDKVKKNSNDRTWCYWETDNDEWNGIVSASWKNIIFKSKLYATKENIAPYQYKMIRSKDFYSKIFSVTCVGLRFFNVYGPYGRPDMALWIFLKNALLNKTIKLHKWCSYQK